MQRRPLCEGWTERGGDKKFCSQRRGAMFPFKFPRVPSSFPLRGSELRFAVSLGKKGSGLEPWVWKGLVPDGWQNPPPDAHQFLAVWLRVSRVLEVFLGFSGFFGASSGDRGWWCISFLFRDCELLMRRSKFSATRMFHMLQ